MKISLVLNAVLAIALVFLSYKLAVTGDGHGGDSDMSEAVLDAILTRTSVRSYEEKSIEKEKVEKLLRAGMAAPSAVNKQPWHFVVITTGVGWKVFRRQIPMRRWSLRLR